MARCQSTGTRTTMRLARIVSERSVKFSCRYFSCLPPNQSMAQGLFIGLVCARIETLARHTVHLKKMENTSISIFLLSLTIKVYLHIICAFLMEHLRFSVISFIRSLCLSCYLSIVYINLAYVSSISYESQHSFF